MEIVAKGPQFYIIKITLVILFIVRYTLDILSRGRGRLTISSIELLKYVSDSFAFIEYVSDDIISSNLPEKRTCLAALDEIIVNEPFLCSIH